MQGLLNLRGLISHDSGLEDLLGPLNQRRPYSELGVREGSRVYSTSRQRVARTECQGRKETRWRIGRVQNIPGNAVKASPDLESRCIRAPLNPFEAAKQLPEGPEGCRGERSTKNALYAHRAQADRSSPNRPGALTPDTPPPDRVIVESRR